MPLPQRRSIRLPEYDYSSPGMYYVTICTQEREHTFGEITGMEMKLNGAGITVQNAWRSLKDKYPFLGIDEHVTMPNHLHGILLFEEQKEPDPKKRIALGNVIAYFKYQTTKLLNQERDNAGTPIWQRNYYEHIVRDEKNLERIQEYIQNNPKNWVMDEENISRLP